MDLDNYSYLLNKERYVLIKFGENEYTVYDLLKKVSLLLKIIIYSKILYI